VQIERLEDWAGQDVVDTEGEKIGKLEDVLFEVGRDDPAYGYVKTGILGRHLSLVPLAGATVTRDHVRVTYAKEQVRDAPQLEAGGVLDGDAESAVRSHYGLDSAGAGKTYESAGARREREARARAADERADELERLAERKAAEARESEADAERRHESARSSEQERDQALSEAQQLRQEARDAKRGPGGSTG
jgi:hypothetical protein